MKVCRASNDDPGLLTEHIRAVKGLQIWSLSIFPCKGGGLGTFTALNF